MRALEERVSELEAASEPVAQESPSQRPEPAPVEAPELVGAHHYRVPRRYFEEMLDDPQQALREARIVPVQKNGQVTGLRMFGIRPDSRLARLGFQNGDQLESLNGIALTDPETALEAYAASRDASTLRVRVLRRGQALELVYDIVE